MQHHVQYILRFDTYALELYSLKYMYKGGRETVILLYFSVDPTLVTAVSYRTFIMVAELRCCCMYFVGYLERARAWERVASVVSYQ